MKRRVYSFSYFSERTFSSIILIYINHFDKLFVAFSCGIFQSPVLPIRTRHTGTADIASHGDHQIYFREVGQEFAILGLLHVDFVDLLHQPNRIRIDLWFCFRTCGIAFKHIRSQLLSQCFCNLASAGIMDTNKGYFFLLLPPYQDRLSS